MLNLLIADDEEIIRDGLKNLIEKSNLGINVCSMAEDGEEAFQNVVKYKPEIILMDVNMPLMDGLKSIEKIREVDKMAKIIIISGYSEFKYAQKALSLGVFSYILKPIDYTELLSTINKAAKDYTEYFISKHEQINNFDNIKYSATEAINYINENFTQSNISLTEVAEIFHMSQSNLTKLIKQKTGYGFTDYLNSLRMTLAMKFLRDTNNNYTIAEISELIGFNSQHYFSRVFKNYFGDSPNKYK